MREFFVTVRKAHINHFPGAEVVHRFQDTPVIHTYCCQESREVGSMSTVVLKVQAESRAAVAKDKPYGVVRRVRVKPPEGGWSSLERLTPFFITIC